MIQMNPLFQATLSIDPDVYKNRGKKYYDDVDSHLSQTTKALSKAFKFKYHQKRETDPAFAWYCVDKDIITVTFPDKYGNGVSYNFSNIVKKTTAFGLKKHPPTRSKQKFIDDTVKEVKRIAQELGVLESAITDFKAAE